MPLTLSDRQLQDMKDLCRSDTPDGFSLFYTMITDAPLPPHARKWVEDLYASGGSVLLEAFRGSTKTTTLTIFMAYQIGLHPELENMLVQVSDQSARNNVAKIADIIDTNPSWKLLFPEVVPDKEQGWGAEGYEVKRADMDYGSWRRIRTPDPTLVGYGYNSSAIIGKHPRGVLLVDDIHDETNTASERELSTVIHILTGTIYPAAAKSRWKLFVGTPWVEGDALWYTKETGEFKNLKTPVMTDGGPDVYDMQPVTLTWAEAYPPEKIVKMRALSGPVEFARMYLLDLSKAGKTIFSWVGADPERINPAWPMVVGVDYAGAMNPARGNDDFAMCYVLKNPNGGVVVYDGVAEQTSQGKAETLMLRVQEVFPTCQQFVVEGDGKGVEFMQLMMRHPALRLVPEKTGGKTKHQSSREVQ